jgi:hypothetical protein
MGEQVGGLGEQLHLELERQWKLIGERLVM